MIVGSVRECGEVGQWEFSNFNHFNIEKYEKQIYPHPRQLSPIKICEPIKILIYEIAKIRK
jgi:hypothetical protein